MVLEGLERKVQRLWFYGEVMLKIGLLRVS